MPFENEEDVLQRYLRSYRPIMEGKIAWERLNDYPRLSEEFCAVLDYIEGAEIHVHEDARFVRASPVYRLPVIRKFVDAWEWDEAKHAEILARAREYLGLPALCQQTPSRFSLLGEKMVLVAAEVAPEIFLKLYLLIASTHELITRYTYTHFGDLCGNPVLAGIFSAIAEQESRHFVFYYRTAELLLNQSPRGRGVIRWKLGQYALVGEAVQGTEAASRVIRALTFDPEGRRLASLVDQTMQKLPGLEGLPIFVGRVEKAFAAFS